MEVNRNFLLPQELMLEVSTYFDEQTLLNAIQVCTSWRRSFHDELVWRWRAERIGLAELYLSDNWIASVKILLNPKKLLLTPAASLPINNGPLTFVLVNFLFRDLLPQAASIALNKRVFPDGKSIGITNEMMGSHLFVSGVDNFGRRFLSLSYRYIRPCGDGLLNTLEVVTVYQKSSHLRKVRVTGACGLDGFPSPRRRNLHVSNHRQWLFQLYTMAQEALMGKRLVMQVEPDTLITHGFYVSV